MRLGAPRLAIMGALRVAATCLLMFAAIPSTAAATAAVRGVPASLQYLYAGPRFTCGDKSKTIDAAQVNDNYCHCPGSSDDEPSTGACANGRFYCVNKGFRGQFVHAQVVGDGVCDCCDGSDEEGRKPPCPNTCERDGASWRAARAAAVLKAEDGALKRLAYEQHGAQSATQRNARVAASTSALAAVKQTVEAAEKVWGAGPGGVGVRDAGVTATLCYGVVLPSTRYSRWLCIRTYSHPRVSPSLHFILLRRSPPRRRRSAS